MRIDSAIITGSFSVNGDTFNDLGVLPSTGSNTFVGNQSIVGAVSASALTGSISYTNLTNVPTLVSGSEQIVSILSPLNSFTASNSTTNTFTSSATDRLNALETTSASVDTLNTTQNTRLTNLENKTGSLATTGSNTFYGTQVFSGSVYVKENLIVQGSSSLQNITASAVDIGTNKIILNSNTPSVRYAGISVYDSGSNAGTGSLFWDSVDNHWLYEHPADSGAPYNSAILISGPKNEGNLGEELDLVSNFIVKAVGGDHISSSAIYDDGTTIKLLSNTEITSSLKVSGSISIGTSDVTGSMTIQSKFVTGQSGSLLNIKSSYTNKNSIIELAELSSDGAIILKHALATSPTVLITSQTGGTSPSYFNNGSNVGIGLTNPSQKLEVASGSIKISNTGYGLILPGAIHTSAQINFYNANTAIELMKLPVANNTITFYANTDKLYYYSDKGSVGNFFTLTTDGYIGIGTTSPDIRMVVKAVSANVSVMAIRSTTNNNLFNFISNDTTGQSIFDMGKNTESGTFVGGYIRLRSDGNSWIQGGNLGIRTITPEQPLHVDQGAVASVNLGVPGTSGTTQRGIVRLTPGQGTYGETLDIGMNVGPTYAWLQSTNTADLATKYSLILNPTGGNIGIGTTNPLAKLEVKASGDGDLFIARYSGGAAKLIYGYQSSADGFLELRTGADSTVTRLSGYSGTSSYFLSNVGIGITNPNGNTLFVYGNLCVQGGGAYGLIKGYDDFYHGLICRGYPTTATNLTDITAGDVMSFYEYGGDYRFYTKNPSSLTQHIRFYLGTIYATNTTVQSVSDVRTKENIRNSSEGLDVISALRPVRFDFKDGFNDNKKNQLGFIAQEVEEVFPDAVSEWTKDDGETYKTMGPSALIPVLVNAIKELKAEIEILKNK